MVKFWEIALKRSYLSCMANIKTGEKHGIGDYTQAEKRRLQKIKKQMTDRGIQ